MPLDLHRVTPLRWIRTPGRPRRAVDRACRRDPAGRSPLLLLFALFLAGCASAPPAHPDPRGVVQAYRGAVTQNDPAAAYALLSREARKETGAEAFARHWRQVRPELTTQARDLARPRTRGNGLEIRASYRHGGQITLREADSLWQVDHPDLLPPPAGTPEAAVRAFLRALDRRDLPGLMRLLSSEARRKLKHRLDQYIEDVSRGLSRGLETGVGRAEVQVSGERSLILIKENNRWKILEVE